MELLQLRKFCHAARSGSFARTAEYFGVPPSDISQTVRRLEEELGVQLFDRHPNAVTLNGRGAIFAQRVQQSLLTLEGAVTSVTDDGESGEVHLCVNCNRRVVMTAVEQFHRRWPNVNLRTRTLCDPTEEGFDLIISAEDASLEHYHRQKLLSEQLAIAISAEGPHAGWNGDLRQLETAPFVTIGEKSSMYRLTHQLCGEAGFIPRVAIQSDDPYYVRKCVELGLGVALVPLFSWQGQFGSEVILHPLPGQLRDTWIYMAPGRYLPLCARRFRDLLMEHCATARKE
ncbi:MAG: LysR family transcriptional regulator [Ruminococcaceae bacterium]|nr:LysR family transcriptional regulator [Oscillospiraceae bacterium]